MLNINKTNPTYGQIVSSLFFFFLFRLVCKFRRKCQCWSALQHMVDSDITSYTLPVCFPFLFWENFECENYSSAPIIYRKLAEATYPHGPVCIFPNRPRCVIQINFTKTSVLIKLKNEVLLLICLYYVPDRLIRISWLVATTWKWNG